MDQARLSTQPARPNLKPRTFSPRVMHPTREQIQEYVKSCFSGAHDPDDVDSLDQIAENAFFHFTGLTTFSEDVPDLYYEAVEEIWTQLES